MIRFEGGEDTPTGCVIVMVLLNVLVWGAMAYVAFHFIRKYW